MATIYATAATLDGFIATDDHSLDWLLNRRTGPGFDFADFLREVGAAVMGASTYEWLARHAGHEPWPYEMAVFVVTHRAEALEAARPELWQGADLRFVPADDDAAVADLHVTALRHADGAHVWIVGGGELAGRFADLDLLDEVRLDLAPCTLGSGAPLLPRRVELELMEVRPNGELIQARYAVAKG